MALIGGGGGNGTVIGFDMRNACIRIMTATQSLSQRMNLDTIPFDEKLLANGDFVSILDAAFQSYGALPTLQQSPIMLVLPDNLVGFDYITIPVMKKKIMDDAIKTEFTNMYKNAANLQYNTAIIIQNKRNALVLLSIIDRTLVNAMQRSLTTQKMQPKMTTFGANATINAVLQLRPKTRRMNFLFVDIRRESTTLIVCGKDRIQAFSSLPFGYEVLSDTEVMPEYMLFEHDVAELAVINATEVAKKKKLTVDADEFEEQERAREIEEAERVQKEAEAERKRQAEEEEKARLEAEAQKQREAEAAERVASGVVPLSDEELTPEEREARELAALEEQIKAEEAAGAEENRRAQEKAIKDIATQARMEAEAEAAAQRTAEAAAAEAAAQAELDMQFDEEEEKKPAAAAPAGKVFARKVPRRLPMFMQRPEPETPEAYILENFRIFEKRILLTRRQCEFDSIMPNLDFVMINMPSRFAFVVDKLNDDEDNAGVDFRYFEPDSDGNEAIAENLDLYGILFANTYNKNNNF